MFHMYARKFCWWPLNCYYHSTARKPRNIPWCHIAKWYRAAVSSTGLERTKEWHGTTPSFTIVFFHSTHNGINQLSTVNDWLKHLYAEFQLTTSRFNCATCHGCYGGHIAPDYYIPTTAVIARSFTHYREICPHSRGVSAVTAVIGYRLYRYRVTH